MNMGAQKTGTVMDSKYPPEAWQRLGKALQRVRGEQGYGYRQRPAFHADRSDPGRISLKMIERLEHGARAAWPDGTVALLEAMYWLPPGSFKGFLDADAAGDETAAAAALRPAPPAPAPGDRTEQVIHRILHAGEHDLRVLRVMDAATNADGALLPWPDRLHMMEEWLTAPERAANPGEQAPDERRALLKLPVTHRRTIRNITVTTAWAGGDPAPGEVLKPKETEPPC